MENERSSVITIGGEQYEMVLTTRATKAISTRYGGLDNLGDRLMKSENMEMVLDEIVWLITLLCNQGIQIHNLKCEDKKDTDHRGNRGASHLSRRACGVQGRNHRSYAERHKAECGK